MLDATAVRANPLAGLDLAPLVWGGATIIVAITDQAGVIVTANPTFVRLARRDPRAEPISAFVGQGQADAFGEWLRLCGRDWSVRTWGLLAGADGVPQDFRLAACIRDDDVILVGEPLLTEDVAAALLDVNAVLVTEQRLLGHDRTRLDRMTREDALTGLANRRAFDGRLTRELARGANGAFSLVMLDIDHFKRVNDELGHPAGDAVLRWLGETLRANARRVDMVARYGGEEFVAILTDTSLSDARGWAERVRQSVGSAGAPGLDRVVTVSLGVAEWHPGETGDAIVARADHALYVAKNTGRD
ncbi:MAG: GGDEF domain-containing protein, partial [Chloroflexota bacterium]